MGAHIQTVPVDQDLVQAGVSVLQVDSHTAWGPASLGSIFKAWTGLDMCLILHKINLYLERKILEKNP